jgi:hypothetical protein
MNITKAISRITVSLLCAVLIFNGLPLHAASSAEELRHEAFLRGGDAISAALSAPAETIPAVSKAAIEEALPAMPPAPRPQGTSSKLSKKMLVILIGGFAASGAIVYWAATGPGASVRNCSTCK